MSEQEREALALHAAVCCAPGPGTRQGLFVSLLFLGAGSLQGAGAQDYTPREGGRVSLRPFPTIPKFHLFVKEGGSDTELRAPVFVTLLIYCCI